MDWQPIISQMTGHIDLVVADKGYDQIAVYRAALNHLVVFKNEVSQLT